MDAPVKPSGAEIVKESSRQLRGTIAEELAANSDHFSKANVGLLKFHGTYQQDDREARKQRKPGEDKSVRAYMFMIRSKIPGGKLTAAQFLTELDLCERFGNGTLRITSRQGLQIHGVLKDKLWPTIHDIHTCLLSTLGACGDVERNVMCCPAPHHGDAVRDRLQAITDQIAAHLAPRTRAYHEIWINGEKLAELPGLGTTAEEPIYGAVYMPRKFKTGLALPHDNCVDIYSNDLGFLAVLEHGRLIGFNVLVGGGMGMTPARKDTFPALAQRLGFIGVDDVIDVATAVVGVQRDFGRRDDRSLARLKYLIHIWGLEKFKAKVEEYYGRKIEEPDPTDVVGMDDHLGWHEQGDGKLYVGVNIENGRIQDKDGVNSKTGLRTLYQKFGPLGMNGRLTPLQSILLTDIQPALQEEINRTLDDNGVLPVSRISNTLRFSMACPAVPTCGLAITESERALPGIIDALEVELAKLGLDAEQFAIHMTGCPNGCARPYNCDIGLVGKATHKYTIRLGGNMLGTRLNFVYKDLVPHDEIIRTLIPLFVYFKADRENRESFGDFCTRKGTTDLEQFTEQYQTRTVTRVS
ncbi:MAG: NADPH-dependent assimilatory sulfite reductase hemoprotein subunit [Planctomycetes bacterium]|nr:NADPH-dependent assimilatory sulfite reductase hemoprotein subunit [Planctomycetota bacterium]